MKVALASANIAPIYPELPASVDVGEMAQTFRLQKINELETFLRADVKQRGRLHKNTVELSMPYMVHAGCILCRD